MRRKRSPETEEQRNERFEKQSQRRIEDVAAEENAMDVLVKQSIQLYGP